MVSFQTPILRTRRKIIPEVMEDSMKKRKRDDSQAEEVLEKPQIAKSMKYSIFETDLNLETPLPLEWQRCLNIKSGQIYYYNSSTQKRTSRDPRASPEPPSPGDHDMSLDLELNLPCRPVDQKNYVSNNSGEQYKNNKNTVIRSPSWLKLDQEEEDQEMVTAVCNKCHILVVMCKSSPSCPNCKFVHPQDKSPSSTLFKRSFNLLC